MRAFAKANVFLKLVGFDERKYHYLVSRFVLLDEIYDEIELTKDKTNAGFEIITKFCELECENGDKFSEFGEFGCENAEFSEKSGVASKEKAEFSENYKNDGCENTEFSGKSGVINKENTEFYDKSSATKQIKGENIIAKAYKMLCECGFKGVLDECFSQFSLKLTKKIPIGGGLGGGSSNAACFLRLMNESLNLGLSRDDLMQMGARLGSDVPFFVSGFKSANVSGTGELIAEFEDEIPPLIFSFPKLECSTAAVYAKFDESLNFKDLNSVFAKNSALANKLKTKTSKELLNAYENTALNDLFTPCVALYPKMSAFLQGGFFLSGSGSSVFKAEF